MQKARNTVSLRNHLRLWLAPFTVGGQQVWVGQISRDIGIKLTTQVWYLTTHRVSPAVDQDRFYLLQDLIMSGAVSALRLCAGRGCIVHARSARQSRWRPVSDRWPSARSVPRHAATGLRSNRVSRLGASSPVERPRLARLQPMSELGQKAKYSRRAHVFRVAPHSGHWVGHVARCSVATCKGRKIRNCILLAIGGSRTQIWDINGRWSVGSFPPKARALHRTASRSLSSLRPSIAPLPDCSDQAPPVPDLPPGP